MRSDWSMNSPKSHRLTILESLLASAADRFRQRTASRQQGALEHGLEFHTLEALLEGHFAVRSVENLNAFQWLGFAEQKLLAFTSGAVFHDDDSRLDRA